MRIELTTLGLLDPRSNQLSYEGGVIKTLIIICEYVIIGRIAGVHHG